MVQFLKVKEGDAVGELRDGQKEESKTDSVSDMETDDSVEVLGVGGKMEVGVLRVGGKVEVEGAPETKRPRVLVEVEEKMERLEEEVRSLGCLLEEQGAPPPAARVRLRALAQTLLALGGAAG